MSRITPSDIEHKLAEIKAEMGATADEAKPTALAVGSTVVAAAVGIAFLLGQRKARKRTTIVEVRRV